MFRYQERDRNELSLSGREGSEIATAFAAEPW